MALEIERKFLIKGDFRKEVADEARIIQGYLSSVPGRTVRVRIKGETGYITVKGISNDTGVERYEWEKEIPVVDALDLLKLCEPGIIDKTRYSIKSGNHTFEVDVFHNDNAGLTLAEVELAFEDEPFEKPGWLGEEVTNDSRFYNSALAKNPYSKW